MGHVFIRNTAKAIKAVGSGILMACFLFLVFCLMSDPSVLAYHGDSPIQEFTPFPLPIPVVTPSPFSSVQPRSKLPEEPDEFDEREVEAYYDWRNDMFFRRFDLTGTGSVDYMTARRTYKVWLDDFGTPVVITVADPLFYWIDLNGNGEFEQDKGEMWSDPYEDGLTGNERPYDSSDLQHPPSEIPFWSAPDPSTPKLPPCDPRLGC